MSPDALKGIRQFFVEVEHEEWKLDTLLDLFEATTITTAIIYCNIRRKVDWLAQKLGDRDFTVSTIHADLDQKERDEIMSEFRSGSSRVLISTDLLARGMDVPQSSLFLNYDLPASNENYLQRIGAPGRFTRPGVAISFVIPQDRPRLKEIERYCPTQIEEMPLDIEDLIGGSSSQVKEQQKGTEGQKEVIPMGIPIPDKEENIPNDKEENITTVFVDNQEVVSISKDKEENVSSSTEKKNVEIIPSPEEKIKSEQYLEARRVVEENVNMRMSPHTAQQKIEKRESFGWQPENDK
eukprot:gene277-109_t